LEVQIARSEGAMDIGFQFEVIYKDADLLEVRIAAWNGSFGGVANVYLDISKLEEAATALKGFPVRSSDVREVTFGAFGPQSAGGGVTMRYYCVDSAGHAFVDSRIEAGSNQSNPTEYVTLSVAIEAAAVDSFVDELRQMGLTRGGKARLAGVPISVRR
jgi:hypothetical protein